MSQDPHSGRASPRGHTARGKDGRKDRIPIYYVVFNEAIHISCVLICFLLKDNIADTL